MKEKIRNFFAGRNGVDDLSNVALWGAVIVMIINIFVSVGWLNSVLSVLSWGGLIYGYFRILSKNVAKRRAENWAFVSWKDKIRQRWQQRKTHNFYNCPKCRTTLRVPKGKGKISITCRKCGEKFIRKT